MLQHILQSLDISSVAPVIGAGLCVWIFGPNDISSAKRCEEMIHVYIPTLIHTILDIPEQRQRADRVMEDLQTEVTTNYTTIEEYHTGMLRTRRLFRALDEILFDNNHQHVQAQRRLLHQTRDAVLEDQRVGLRNCLQDRLQRLSR